MNVAYRLFPTVAFLALTALILWQCCAGDYR